MSVYPTKRIPLVEMVHIAFYLYTLLDTKRTILSEDPLLFQHSSHFSTLRIYDQNVMERLEIVISKFHVISKL